MPITAEELYKISAGSTELVAFAFTEHLDSGELLTGTPTVVEVTTAATTLGNKVVNGTAYTDAHTKRSVAVSEAVQFTITSSTAGTYRIRITVSTDSTPARTFVRDILIQVV